MLLHRAVDGRALGFLLRFDVFPFTAPLSSPASVAAKQNLGLKTNKQAKIYIYLLSTCQSCYCAEGGMHTSSDWLVQMQENKIVPK